MKKLIYHIVRLALVMIPVVLTVAPAMAQLEVYQGDTLNLSIAPEPEGSTYKWDVYCDFSVNFAQVDGNCPDGTYYFVNNIDNEAAVQAIFNTAGEYIIKIEVWDPVSCTNNMEFIKLIVLEALPEAELALNPDEICVDEPSVLTVTLTGEPLWGFIIEARDEDGNITDLIEIENIDLDDNPYELVVMPTETTIYQVIEVTDYWGVQTEPSNAVTLTVHPLPENSRIYLKED